MKILSNVLFCVLLFSLAQADDKKVSVVPSADGGCGESELVKTAKLSCVVCGLKKINRPIPDDNYLAMMGLLVREKSALFEDELKGIPKHSRRRPLSSDYTQSVLSKNGTVLFTPSAKYQKSVIQMLLSAGYCSQGKVKSKSPDTMHKHFASRIDSDVYPEYEGNKKELKKGDLSERDKHKIAVKELGFESWENAQDDLWIKSDPKDPFLSRSFDSQKDSYKKLRTSAIGRGENGEGSWSWRSGSDIYDCFQDIEKNYAPTYFSNEKANEACNAIYDECKIATDESGKISRNNARVGGDWCDNQYKVTVESEKRHTGALFEKDRQKPIKEAVRSDGTPLAPAEDKSRTQLPNGDLLDQDGIIYDAKGNKTDTKKVFIYPDGTTVLLPGAWTPKPTEPKDPKDTRGLPPK